MILGVILILLSSAAQNGSAVFLAVAARSRSDKTGPTIVIGVARHAKGILGMVMNTTGWLLELAALTRISLTLDRIIMTAGFGLVLVLAHQWLKEPIGWHELVGAGAIALGIVAVGVMPVGYSQAEPSVWGWLIIVLILLPGVVAPSVYRMTGRLAGPIFAAVGAGIAYALTGAFTKGLADLLSLKHLIPLAALLIGVGVVDTLGFTNELFALQHESASATVPIVAALREVIPIAMAPFIFREVWPSATWKETIMAAGVLLNVIGVVILARAHASIYASGSRSNSSEQTAGAAGGSGEREEHAT